MLGWLVSWVAGLALVHIQDNRTYVESFKYKTRHYEPHVALIVLQSFTPTGEPDSPAYITH